MLRVYMGLHPQQNNPTVTKNVFSFQPYTPYQVVRSSLGFLLMVTTRVFKERL